MLLTVPEGSEYICGIPILNGFVFLFMKVLQQNQFYFGKLILKCFTLDSEC